MHVSEHTRNFFGEADVYDDFHPGDDPSEIFGVREFRAGDKMQSIHWKLSAKSDDLLVRENSQPKACPLVFLLEPPHMKKEMEKEEGKNPKRREVSYGDGRSGVFPDGCSLSALCGMVQCQPQRCCPYPD